ncbi:hypothetical protein KQX54_000783 [Cotesia glomerata]|uniref:Uncharacterized protein n=1 Tax=Cotesia glomerata TaxID=32391 RepID=A0AAV7IL21_COTGL|nr:hypothetical protein KQX54_000783 [Cotesia glomerata]
MLCVDAESQCDILYVIKSRSKLRRQTSTARAHNLLEEPDNCARTTTTIMPVILDVTTEVVGGNNYYVNNNQAGQAIIKGVTTGVKRYQGNTGAEINLIRDSTLGTECKNRPIPKRTRDSKESHQKLKVISLGQVKLEIEGRTTIFDVVGDEFNLKEDGESSYRLLGRAQERGTFLAMRHEAPGKFIFWEMQSWLSTTVAHFGMYAYNTTDEEHILFTVPYLEVGKFEEKLNEATIHSVYEEGAKRRRRGRTSSMQNTFEIIPTEHLREEE